MTMPRPFCPHCGHDMHQLGKPEAITLWYSWRCPSCSQQMTTRPIAGAEASSRYFHVVKVWQ